MLKITLVFGLVLVSVVLGAPPKKLVDIPASAALVIAEAATKCASTTNKFNLSELFAMVREGIWNDDPDFIKFMGCSFIASGFATSDGNVIVDKAIGLFEGKDDAKKVIIQCAKEEGPNAHEKLFNFYKCYQEKSPYTLNLIN